MYFPIRRTALLLTLAMIIFSLMGLPVKTSAKSIQYPTTQQAKLLASDPKNSDFFGTTVALSGDGNTAMVLAGDNTIPNNNSGAVYVYVRSGTTWTQQAKLVADDTASGDLFGTSIAMSNDGNIALISAYNEDTSPNTDNGAAYIFTRSGTTWTQQTKLLAADAASNDAFGYSVALSGDGSIAIIGAYGESTAPNNGNGAAYIFSRSGNVWSQDAKLFASDPIAMGWFGWSVALNSNASVAVVGSIFNNAGYVFTRSGNVWTQQAKLVGLDTATNDSLGWNVKLSNDGATALLTAPFHSSSPLTKNGAAYILLRVNMDSTGRIAGWR